MMKRIVLTWLVALGVIVAGAVQTHSHAPTNQSVRISR